MAVGTGHGPLDHMWAAHDVFARAGDHGDAQDVASQWWADIMGIRHAIDELEFVQRLGNGTLPPEVFGWYVHQDSAYLREYSRALAMASTLAPTREEQELWARGAHSAIHVEAGMHHTWLAHAQMEQPVVTSQVTHGYVNHFLSYAARGDYEGLIAALLPCYWLYQDIGMRLYQRYWTSEHPYATWLATYHDEDFAAATAAVIDVVTTVPLRALMRAPPSGCVMRLLLLRGGSMTFLRPRIGVQSHAVTMMRAQGRCPRWCLFRDRVRWWGGIASRGRSEVRARPALFWCLLV